MKKLIIELIRLISWIVRRCQKMDKADAGRH